eukprot:comp17504_c1_seq1/m.17026 comp17504_c1_seq1/g.17026  ORF comp17504_c1_seq1/g.17026 comp17504_c1_seq1/m.17026 type:complete len:145 (-) comp17504_c1_seq1:278-712(-)
MGPATEAYRYHHAALPAATGMAGSHSTGPVMVSAMERFDTAYMEGPTVDDESTEPSSPEAPPRHVDSVAQPAVVPDWMRDWTGAMQIFTLSCDKLRQESDRPDQSLRRLSLLKGTMLKNLNTLRRIQTTMSAAHTEEEGAAVQI